MQQDLNQVYTLLDLLPDRQPQVIRAVGFPHKALQYRAVTAGHADSPSGDKVPRAQEYAFIDRAPQGEVHIVHRGDFANRRGPCLQGLPKVACSEQGCEGLLFLLRARKG